MKTLLRSALLSTVAIALFAIAQPARGQGPVRPRYVPKRPVFSPYMEYFRRDTGLMDPYNTFRSRQVRQNQLYRQQQQQFRMQQQRLEQQRLELQRVQGAVRQFRESGAGPTGHASTFMNYSHYFGQSPNSGSAGPTRR